MPEKKTVIITKDGPDEDFIMDEDHMYYYHLEDVHFELAGGNKISFEGMANVHQKLQTIESALKLSSFALCVFKDDFLGEYGLVRSTAPDIYDIDENARTVLKNFPTCYINDETTEKGILPCYPSEVNNSSGYIGSSLNLGRDTKHGETFFHYFVFDIGDLNYIPLLQHCMEITRKGDAYKNGSFVITYTYKKPTAREKVHTLTITRNGERSTDLLYDPISIRYSYKWRKFCFKSFDGESAYLTAFKTDKWKPAGFALKHFGTILNDLTQEQKKDFPVSYDSSGNIYRGIYTGVEKPGPDYYYASLNNKKWWFPCQNPLTNIPLIQHCLQLNYEKNENNDGQFIMMYTKDVVNENLENLEDFSIKLIKAKNVILRGAPGTGKTFLAKNIAEYFVYNNPNRVGFVQFHPGYDYSDFVEGLRPKTNEDGTIGFELKDGIFKEFIEKAKKDPNHKYVFIIDEINRGEISKIFGELFFSIDPGYRGEKGKVFTQYANLHEDPDEMFYIPDNVYIIGTMNDIDRSVDSFDFAMRRRFRFVEITAKESQRMLDNADNGLSDFQKAAAIRSMDALNEAIADTDGLNENYQIGAAYFLKLKELSKTELWDNYLQPLLLDYVQGMDNEKEIMKKFKDAYNQG